MRKAVGLIELLFVIVIILVVYLTCFSSKSGRSNPFAEIQDVKTKQEAVDKKIQEINETRAIKQKIEQNLDRENY